MWLGKPHQGEGAIWALMSWGPGKMLIRCSKESQHPAKWTPASREQERHNVDSHNNGVKILQLCSISNSHSQWNTTQPFSNPCNKVRELSSLSLKSKSITNASTKTPSQDEKLEELRIIFLEEEVRKLRHAYQELRKRNAYLSQLLEQSEGRRRRQMSAIESLRYQLNQCGVKYSMEPSLPPPPTVQSYALVNDLIPRQRTIPELEAFIKHLQQVNEKQAHELETLKSDLRDVLYSHKWTPDAYLLAKAYIVEDDAKAPVKDANKLGKIQLKQNTRKLRDIGYVTDSITLPPLKQTVGNRAVERRKRTQILQKERIRRSEVL